MQATHFFKIIQMLFATRHAGPARLGDGPGFRVTDTPEVDQFGGTLEYQFTKTSVGAMALFR